MAGATRQACSDTQRGAWCGWLRGRDGSLHHLCQLYPRVTRMASMQASSTKQPGTGHATYSSPFEPCVHQAHFALLVPRALDAGWFCCFLPQW
jgi:hypothetical protein